MFNWLKLVWRWIKMNIYDPKHLGEVKMSKSYITDDHDLHFRQFSVSSCGWWFSTGLIWEDWQLRSSFIMLSAGVGTCCKHQQVPPCWLNVVNNLWFQMDSQGPCANVLWKALVILLLRLQDVNPLRSFVPGWILRMTCTSVLFRFLNHKVHIRIPRDFQMDHIKVIKFLYKITQLEVQLIARWPGAFQKGGPGAKCGGPEELLRSKPDHGYHGPGRSQCH